MRLSLGCKGESESESGSDGVEVGVSWVAGFADLLPVVSGVLTSNSLTINDVSFSGNGAALLVVLGFKTLVGFTEWYWRNAFLSPSNKVSRFSVSFATKLWLLKGSLPYPSLKAMATDRLFSGVLVCKSLIIDGFSFSGNMVLSANGTVVACG